MSKKLVYINIDGFSYSYYKRLCQADKGYVFENIKEKGVFFDGLRSGLISITNPMQSAILCGAFSEKTHNFYQHYDFATRSVVRHYRTFDAKNVADVFVAHGKTVVSIHQFMLENNPCEEGVRNRLYVKCPQQPSNYAMRFDVLDKIARGEAVRSGEADVRYDDFPDFVALYLDDIDSLGHNNDYENMPKREFFWQRANDIDGRLQLIFQRIDNFLSIAKERGFYDDLVVLITTDHGMTPFYGKSSLDELVQALNDNGISTARADSQYNGQLIVALPYTIEVSLYASRELTAEEKCKISNVISSLEFVDKVVDKRNMLEQYGMDSRCPDFIVSPVKGSHFYKKDVDGQTFGASHDSMDDSSQHIFGCIVSGELSVKSIKDSVSAIDLMPTVLYRFFRYTLPDATGRVVDID